MKIYMIGQKGIPTTAGGVERHVEELAIRLAKEGHEVYAYCRPYYTNKKIKKYRGVNLIHLPSLKTKHLDAISHTLLASFDVLRRDADIIHYHAIGPASMCWLPKIFKPAAKIIATPHSQDYHHQKWGFFARLYLRFGEQIACRLPAATISISKTLQKHSWSAYQCDSVYIPNGTPKAMFARAKEIAKWGLKGNDYLLSVSRLVRHKGVHHLIKAYQGLRTSKKLVIVGDSAFTDDYVNELKELAKGDSNIIFTGNQNGRVLNELYANCYAFVQPSEAEGLSIALLEAMSFGRPVLVSDIPENLEVVDGVMNKNFVTFQHRNVIDLRKKLEKLLRSPVLAENIGKKAKTHIENNYNWDDITRKVIRVYSNVMKERSHILRPGQRFFRISRA